MHSIQVFHHGRSGFFPRFHWYRNTKFLYSWGCCRAFARHELRHLNCFHCAEFVSSTIFQSVCMCKLFCMIPKARKRRFLGNYSFNCKISSTSVLPSKFWTRAMHRLDDRYHSGETTAQIRRELRQNGVMSGARDLVNCALDLCNSTLTEMCTCAREYCMR